VLRSHYDDQVELRGQTARNSLSVSAGTAEATTETLSSQDIERIEATWNYLAQEGERKQKEELDKEN
jgi:hypothetical protein